LRATAGGDCRASAEQQARPETVRRGEQKGYLVALMTEALIAGALAMVGSLVLTPVFRTWALRRNRLDVPNERSSHQMPTPRNGGSAMAVAVVLAVGVFGRVIDAQLAVLGAAAVMVTLLALADEHRALPQWLRLLVQFIVAAVAVLALEYWPPSFADAPFGVGLPIWVLGAVAILWITWVINAYNFMDGINGIASTQAIVCGVTLGLLFARVSDVAGQVLAFSLAGAALGFLPWNFPSASIFMGDVGAYMFGFFFSALALRAGAEQMLIPAALPLLPFLSDATGTLVRRIAKREAFFRAHRSHYYQRLNILGWSHARVTSVWTFLALACSVVALSYDSLSPANRTVAVVALLALHACVALSIMAAERARSVAAG
jgi:UDP-N-acetylmuramyl pentapeptide phosphotransferase/UDP-N-acetylglucosamine-1-phosphate transferase